MCPECPVHVSLCVCVCVSYPEAFLPGGLEQLDHLQRTAQLSDGRHRVLNVIAVLVAVAIQLRKRKEHTHVRLLAQRNLHVVSDSG